VEGSFFILRELCAGQIIGKGEAAMTNNISIPNDYKQTLEEIKRRVRSAQYEALKAVNKEQIALYWDIGRIIVSRQKSKGWGKSIVEQLSADLRQEFPGITGFSTRNIWYMRKFYLLYRGNPKLQPLVAEIAWTHNLIILDKCKDDMEREFYIRMTAKFGWTKNVLALRIQDKAYEKTLLNQTNFEKILPESIKNQARLAVRDEYTFDFLELNDEHTERELELAIISKIERFLREMGGMFAFMGSQYRLEVDGDEFFIDLLLYHRTLKCLVAIELKINEFKPEYVGKMQFYLAVLDDKIKLPDENPSIGMILCREKKRAIVEYALKESNKPIGVSAYRIIRRLPKELKGMLPDPKQIEKLLETMEVSVGISKEGKNG
jgi:predicted nuclease of restriction endonuclease-like (RecB) superfamily